MRTKKLLTYAVVAGVGYFLYKKFAGSSVTVPAASVATTGAIPPALAAGGGVNGLGRLGYNTDGSDRPFAQRYAGTPGWYRTSFSGGRW